jgi:hypothetical protein
MKTNVERVLDYLWSVSLNGATNAEIRVATGIQPHQQVYMITSELVQMRFRIRFLTCTDYGILCLPSGAS